MNIVSAWSFAYINFKRKGYGDSEEAQWVKGFVAKAENLKEEDEGLQVL